MFGITEQRARLGRGELAATFAVVAVLVAAQTALLAAVVGRPLERAVIAAREPSPAMVLVRVPEYVEEIEVVGPPRWLRDLSRAETSRRGDLLWLAGAPLDAGASLVCPRGR